MAQKLVTVFGGSGFVGTALVEHLAKAGYQVRVAVRRPNSALHVKPLGDVGQVQVVQANLRDEKSIAAAVIGSDMVVNLVGVLFESGAQKFQTLHARGAGLIAKISAAADVKRLVHISAIGADPEAASHYCASKGKGEEAVRHYFPAATILRPSVIFGLGDNFFNKFAKLASYLPFMPVVLGDSKFQPVYVGDVASAIVACLADVATAGKDYEIGGPEVISFRDLLARTLAEAHQDIPLVDVPLPLAKIKAVFLGLLPNPLITLDQVRVLEQDRVVSAGAEGLEALGVTATPVEAVLASYMVQYRPKGQFS